MKRKYFLFPMIVALLLAHPLFSQPAYNLRISDVENEAVVGGNFDLTVEIQAVSDSFGVGTSNLVFRFNSLAISDPSLLASYNFSGGIYNDITVTEPDTVNHLVSINIVFNGFLDGTIVNNTLKPIVRIRFKIADLAENASITWRTDRPHRTGVFADDYTTIATPNQLDGFDIILSVENSKSGLPGDFSLGQNYPNPFNPTTQIQFQVAEQTDVKLAIFNLLGQKVRTLVNSNYHPGFYNVAWDGRDSQGLPSTSGVYLYQLQAGNFLETRRMVLLK